MVMSNESQGGLLIPGGVNAARRRCFQAVLGVAGGGMECRGSALP
jgi:hypothetical protein